MSVMPNATGSISPLACGIHEADRAAAPSADCILTGREPVEIDADLTAIPVPGHTEGSVVYLYDQRCLFTGDSLGTLKPMISKHSANTVGGRGPSNCNRSSNYSTAGSNGCLP